MTRLRKFKRESFALWKMPATEEERNDLLKTLETNIDKHKCKKKEWYMQKMQEMEKRNKFIQSCLEECPSYSKTTICCNFAGIDSWT